MEDADRYMLHVSCGGTFRVLCAQPPVLLPLQVDLVPQVAPCEALCPTAIVRTSKKLLGSCGQEDALGGALPCTPDQGGFPAFPSKLCRAELARLDPPAKGAWSPAKPGSSLMKTLSMSNCHDSLYVR